MKVGLPRSQEDSLQGPVSRTKRPAIGPRPIESPSFARRLLAHKKTTPLFVVTPIHESSQQSPAGGLDLYEGLTRRGPTQPQVFVEEERFSAENHFQLDHFLQALERANGQLFARWLWF